MRNTLLVGVLLVGSVSAAWGQSDTSPQAMAQAKVDSSLYLKAQSMVSNGDADKGRDMVDSLVQATSPKTAQYAEGLYWRAKLSASSDKAEQDYRRIIVEYPFSPRVVDALLRLGQLELARAQRDKALEHFKRLTLEHPESPLYASASYWTARALFEANDAPKACAANADALSHVRSSDIELKNQIDFQNQRCRGVQVVSADTTAVSAVGQVASAGGDKSSASKSNASKSVPVKVAPTAAEPDVPVSEETVADKAPVKTKTKTATKATTAAATRGKYMVQVAAFKSKTQAQELADGLQKKGYNVHVDGSKPLYRVRIGHYRTHADAAAMLKKLQAKNIDGFVTEG